MNLSINSAELLLRSLGVVLCALLAACMMRANHRNDAARMGSALCVSVSAFLLTSAPDAAQMFGWLIYPFSAICSTHPVWFWLFCAALFRDNFKLGAVHWIALAGMGGAGLLYQMVSGPDPSGISARLVGPLAISFGGAALVFAALAPLTAMLEASTDLDDRRRRIRRWFVPVLAIYVGLVSVVEVLSTLAGNETPKPLVLANLVLINGVATLGLLTFVELRFVNWLSVTESRQNAAPLGKAERELRGRLVKRFESERLYALEKLSIRMLAEKLGTQEHVLRRVINHELGYRNFNDFLHAYRLREAVGRLVDPTSSRTPVLSIALDVGYSSIGPFNRAFKERFGVTPTTYRRSGLQQVRPSNGELVPPLQERVQGGSPPYRP